MNKFPMPRLNMNIVIYGKKNCPYCVASQKLLKEIGLKYHYYSIEKLVKEKILKKPEEIVEKVKNKTDGYQYVPMICIYGEFLGGFTELQDVLSIAVQEQTVPTLEELRQKYQF